MTSSFFLQDDSACGVLFPVFFLGLLFIFVAFQSNGEGAGGGNTAGWWRRDVGVDWQWRRRRPPCARSLVDVDRLCTDATDRCPSATKCDGRRWVATGRRGWVGGGGGRVETGFRRFQRFSAAMILEARIIACVSITEPAPIEASRVTDVDDRPSLC